MLSPPRGPSGLREQPDKVLGGNCAVKALVRSSKASFVRDPDEGRILVPLLAADRARGDKSREEAEDSRARVTSRQRNWDCAVAAGIADAAAIDVPLAAFLDWDADFPARPPATDSAPEREREDVVRFPCQGRRRGRQYLDPMDLSSKHNEQQTQRTVVHRKGDLPGPGGKAQNTA